MHPRQKAPEWDIDAIKERMKGKKIVFWKPGRGCSFCVSEELCTTVLGYGTEWNEYSDHLRLLFYGELCTL